ncbi:cystathionine beta-synthase [Kitasatospora aureofaciens]|uniref:Cystathionine beta-synthase n=1 Tax=Kitasatospora aureofaciens TaxID=1894 RepID=A0A1E7N193_KITAU|nr:cystathionine beta-synthase [Kitasatospora aureofaciens]QEV00137.1 cystathionine beta-synthase [Streptomyces viridifaciens]ARF78932.1 cystathionine beta-synthase [Kitasatospora aureofaciens]OEV34469.1 cystathionine beta-synthase [Kitasatospora aureofaciens]UKZ06331.1 cystathionine beta-synthase [Streptomyces viridifaciens]GGU76143.1 cystathionine beta-synthase [Kitasatospora aureofaciens]
MRYHNSIIDLVGNTPLVKLNKVTEGISATVLAKVEYFNPGGSVKDRIAMRMIEAAEASGALKPGGTIVEPTSGNTGVGLAIVAQQKGYKCIFVCPDKVSTDKINTLRAYGAEVVVCPTAVAPEHPDSYYNVSDRLVRETPNAWKPDQYSNPDNPASHYHSTGPELWEQTDGRITHFVAGVGTGGTISGTGNYLKEVSGGKVKVVGADPEGSVYSGGTGRPYLVEGVGEDFWPTAYDRNVADEIVAVSDKDSFQMTRRLAKEEGLLVGGSCGMAVVAALEVARKLGPDDVVVVLLPDGGRGYLSKIFNDDWMADYGFLPSSTDEAHIGEVLARKESVAQGGVPQFVHMHPNETVAEAVRVLREYGVSQMPVVSPGAGHPDIMAGEVIGSVVEKLLLEGIFAKEIELTDTLDKVMSKPLPVVGSGETVTNLMTVLEKADAAVVLVEGKPQGIVTRQDLLSFLTTRGAH